MDLLIPRHARLPLTGSFESFEIRLRPARIGESKHHARIGRARDMGYTKMIAVNGGLFGQFPGPAKAGRQPLVFLDRRWLDALLLSIADLADNRKQQQNQDGQKLRIVSWKNHVEALDGRWRLREIPPAIIPQVPIVLFHSTANRFGSPATRTRVGESKSAPMIISELQAESSARESNRLRGLPGRLIRIGRR